MATHTITKATLANTLFDQLGLNKREAKEFVDLFFEQIRQALEIGESVKLSGFGGFTIREKNSRPGRNPKTGEVLENWQQVCPACFRNFASDESGSKHRRRRKRRSVICVHPKTVGMWLKKNRFGTEVWTHR